ncbi:MAG: hypothetical protein U0Q16_04905 [Bryobacteraceae bacterium]
MKTLQISEASRPLSDYARDAGDGVVVVEDNGRPIAAVVSLDNVDAESLALSHHPEFMALIDQSRSQFAAGQTLSLSQMKAAVLQHAPKRTKRRPAR